LGEQAELLDTAIDFFNLDIDGPSEVWRSWYLSSLDLDSRYKLAYIETIGEYVGAALRQVESSLRGDRELQEAGFQRLSDVVAGIEVFNEVDVRNSYRANPGPALHRRVNIPLTANKWAEACHRASVGLLRGLGEARVPLWLPGVSSYHDNAEDGIMWTFNDKMSFLSILLRRLRARHINRPQLRQLGATLAVWGNVDYHWYHRAVNEAAPAALIVREAVYIRSLLRRLNFSSTQVSMTESGISIYPHTIPIGGEAEHDNFFPSYASTAQGRRLFQAREVWRRMGAGLASPLKTVGWHSWMSLSPGPNRDGAAGCASPGVFTGMGLRDDFDLGNRCDELESSVHAYQRLSYHAYRRLASYLGDVVNGELMWPDEGVAGEIRSVSLRTNENRIGIAKFRVESSDHIFYLLWFESMASDCLLNVVVDVLPARSRVEEVVKIDTIPNDVYYPSTT